MDRLTLGLAVAFGLAVLVILFRIAGDLEAIREHLTIPDAADDDLPDR